jgi:pullulanase/glycogen debranching enzyme
MDPQESVNYVSKHDNQELWDIIQYKAKSDVRWPTRARMQVIGMSTVLLGQGVPLPAHGLRAVAFEVDGARQL